LIEDGDAAVEARAPQRLDPTRVAPAPWRNGAGATRELAARRDPAGRLLWRISLASLDRDAPFSTFPGLDRLFVALGPLRLVVDAESHTLVAGQQLRFAGEASVRAVVDVPTQALNVMTQRGALQARVALREADAPATEHAEATVLLGALAADVLLDRSA
jgi:environmental stress-induced protein Ves